MIYLPFKNLKNFTERGQKKFKKIIAHNGSRLCVCLPLAQSFKLPQMLMGQIAQNRCYA
jgi:hypothetical protein